jgi:hypothetical protein
MDDLEAGNVLSRAAQNAFEAGKLTADQHAKVSSFFNDLTGKQRRELIKLAGIDWASLFTLVPKFLPILISLIPGIGPFAGIITALLPYIAALINNGPTPVPTPFPTPTPVPLPPDGGGLPTPVS